MSADLIGHIAVACVTGFIAGALFAIIMIQVTGGRGDG